MKPPWPEGTLRTLARRVWQSATQRVMSVRGAGMGVAVAVDILIAARLGTSGETDALIIALSLPLLVDTVTRESSNFSLVPIFVRERGLRDADQFRAYVSGLLNLGLACGFGLMVVVELLAPVVVRSLGPGLSEPARREGVAMLRLAGPILLFAPAITLQGVLLDSQRRFTLTAMRNVVAPGVVILVIGLTWLVPHAGRWIAGAYGLGFAVYFALLWMGVRSSGYRHRWSAWPSRADVKTIRGAVGWPSLGFAVRQGSRFIERMLASLVAVGGVSAFYFAFRLFSASQTLIGSSVATTGLPALSAMHADGRADRLVQTLGSRVKLAAALALPVAVVVLWLHDPIVALLYQRGAFGSASVQQTGTLLFWFGWGIVFLCLVPVVQSALYAQGAYRLVFRNMLVMAALNVTLAWGLSRLMGLSGLAIAESITALATLANAALLLERAGAPVPWAGDAR